MLPIERFAGSSESPPWVQSCPIRMPREFAGRALPSRRFPQAVPPAPALDTVIAQLRKQLGTTAAPDRLRTDPSLWPTLEFAWAKVDNPVTTVSARAQAALLALLVMPSPHHLREPLSTAPLIDALVERDGLLPTLDSVLLAQTEFQIETAWLERQFLRLSALVDRSLSARPGDCPVGEDGWALRRQFSVAAPAIYTQCVQKIVDVLPGLHPVRQISMALLLPDEPQISNALALAMQGKSMPKERHWLRLTATDPAALVAAGAGIAPADDALLGNPRMLATLIQERGLDALPLLVPAAAEEQPGLALGGFGVPAAIDALARVASTSKGALVRLANAAERWPLAAVVGLAGVAAGNSKEARLVTTLLQTLLHQHEPALPTLRPWLGNAAAAVVDRLRERIAEPVEFARVDDLPPVLARPPWLAPRKAAAPSPIALDPLPLAAVECWEPGVREAALAQHEYRRQRVALNAGDPLHLVQALGFNPRNFPEHAEPHAAAIEAIRRHDTERLIQIWRQANAGKRLWMQSSELALLPASLAVPLWNALAGEGDHEQLFRYIAVVFGLQVLPGLQKTLDMHDDNLLVAMNIGAVGFAATMARAFAKLKRQREIGRSWLLKFPEHAACGLLADALGKPGEARESALAALRLLAANGHTDLLRAIAARFRQPEVAAALEYLLAEDPLDRFPQRRSALPGFWAAASWQRPRLAHGSAAGKTLPDAALDVLGTMLAFPAGEGRYPGLEQVRETCTQESLAAFCWDLFQAWMYAGFPAKDGWALTALGVYGDDECARRLAPLIRAWPGEAAHARAVTGLEVLASIGTDVALMQLNGIAQKLKFKKLQDLARAKIDEIAQARGLSVEELEDRLVPELGLSQQGTLALDFGPRAFTVGFDEQLRPFVRDAAGARLTDLPKPRKSDDAELAKVSTERFKDLKKDVRMLASQQLLRLELAMCARRRWRPHDFELLLARHPLLRHLVQRLVWAVYAQDRLLHCFRVDAEGSLSGADDAPFELPADAEAMIGIPHPLELGAMELAAFAERFADYELLQPFAQLARDTHALTAAEHSTLALERWNRQWLPLSRVLGLLDRGWRRGAPEDGWTTVLRKSVGDGRAIELVLDPGIAVGRSDEILDQAIRKVIHGRVSASGEIDVPEPFSRLDPIAASELIRELNHLTASRD